MNKIKVLSLLTQEIIERELLSEVIMRRSVLRFVPFCSFLLLTLTLQPAEAVTKKVSPKNTYLIHLNVDSISAAIAHDPVLEPYSARRQLRGNGPNDEIRQRRDETTEKQRTQIKKKKDALQRALSYVKANKILHSFENVIAAAVVPDLTPVQLRKLKARGYVIEKQEPLTTAMEQSIGKTGAFSVHTPAPDGPGLTGKDVTIAIVDTGADLSHEDLGNCTWDNSSNKTFFNTVDKPCPRFVSIRKFCTTCGKEGEPVTPIAPLAADWGTHGTHVASIAAGKALSAYGWTGVAPDANLAIYVVCNGNTSAPFCPANALIAALEHIGNNLVAKPVDVVNLSLKTISGAGSSTDSISIAVDNLVARGVVVVTAAGNLGAGDGTRSMITTPGTAELSITVGSTYDSGGSEDNVTSESGGGPADWQEGDKPDLVAPGEPICAAFSTYGVTTPSNYYSQHSCDPTLPTGRSTKQQHVSLHGTSMATPHVAGAAALILQKHSDWTPMQVKDALKKTAWRRTGENPNRLVGMGRLNVPAAVQYETHYRKLVYGTIYQKPETQLLPLPDVRVSVLSFNRRIVFATAQTGADGKFEVRGEIPDGMYFVRISKDGYVTYSGLTVLRSTFALPFAWTLYPPVLAALPPEVPVNEDETLSLTVAASDQNKDALQLGVSDLPPGATFVDNQNNTGKLGWVPTGNQVGDHGVTIKVTDGFFTPKRNMIIRVVNVNDAPVIQAPSQVSTAEGRHVEFAVSATDEDTGDIVRITCDNLPAGAAFDEGSGVFSWTPGFEAGGTYDISFTARDTSGASASSSVEVAVRNSTIYGVITERRTAAPIPDVSVRVTDKDTGASHSTMTDKDGRYVLEQDLPAGHYTLQAKKTTFSTFVDNLKLTSGVSIRRDCVMNGSSLWKD